jgi:MtN3 and saliva related transmembrane protein
MGNNWTEILGIAAGFCTAISLLPQLIKLIKKKKAEEISLFYLIILLTGLILWIIYGVVKKDIPIIATNVVSLVLNVITIVIGVYYKKNPKA